MMKIITSDEKKEIKKDWKLLLSDYKLYNTYIFIKRNGPVLMGIDLKPTDGKTCYTPQFFTHLLLDPFPAIKLDTLLPLLTTRKVPYSVSYRRHHNEFDKIAAEFKRQFPEVFSENISCKTISNLFNRTIPNHYGYPSSSMRNHIVLLYWCNYTSLIEDKIEEYKSIIKSWPDSVKEQICNEEQWEQTVRKEMNMGTLRKNMEDGIIKFKLTKYKDYGFLCD